MVFIAKSDKELYFMKHPLFIFFIKPILNGLQFYWDGDSEN